MKRPVEEVVHDLQWHPITQTTRLEQVPTPLPQQGGRPWCKPTQGKGHLRGCTDCARLHTLQATGAALGPDRGDQLLDIGEVGERLAGGGGGGLFEPLTRGGGGIFLKPFCGPWDGFGWSFGDNMGTRAPMGTHVVAASPIVA